MNVDRDPGTRPAIRHRSGRCVSATSPVPEGHLVALVGPNGAGKTTLLNIAVGLTSPTAGEISVLGGVRVASPAALDGIGFVAQDMPLYRNLSVTDMLHMTRNLNHGFDDVFARRRLDELGIDRKRKTGKLSGGQQAQLALTLALARHPRLLVLDEPTARLDPVARHDFMATVVTAMADEGLSVVLSSHVLAELERVADYLVLLTGGVVRIDGAIDDLLARHRVVTGPRGEPADPRWLVIEARETQAQRSLLVRADAAPVPHHPGGRRRPVGVEELALAYLREAPGVARPVVMEVGR